MTNEAFETRIPHLNDRNGVYSSGDFQCDASNGFPVCLIWSAFADVAWIEPVWSLEEDQYQEALTYCSEYGFHKCSNYEDYNAILRDLDRDAYTFWSLAEDPFEYEEEEE